MPIKKQSSLTLLTYPRSVIPTEGRLRPQGTFLKQTASVGFLAALEMTNFNLTLSR